MPGGGMEWGERPEQTAERELFEETGYRTTVGPLLEVYSEWIEAGSTVRTGSGHVLAAIYAAGRLTGELRTEFDPDDTTDAAAWFSLEQVRRLRRVPLVDFVLDLIDAP